MDNKEKKDGKKKTPLLAKIIMGLAGAIVLAVIVCVCYVFHFLSLPQYDGDGTAPSINEEITTASEEQNTDEWADLPLITAPSTSEGETTSVDYEVKHDEDIYNIILLGADPRSGYLTDSMIVVSINQKDNSIKMTSFMRDMLVTIPGYAPNKLNVVYQRGGMNLLKQVFRENFEIELYGYVMVDYLSLIDVVDALGGVEIYVSEKIANFLNTSNFIEKEEYRNIIPNATQTLNGYQVVGYCRQRELGNGYESDDFARTQRQRYVLNAIYEKFRTKSLAEILAVMKEILPLITTDMTEMQMLSIATKAINGGLGDIEQLRIPINNSYEDYRYQITPNSDIMRVIKFDPEKNITKLHEFIFGSTTDTAE